MHGLRPEYQDRVNFVILDRDDRAEFALARSMGLSNQPAYGIIPPDGGPDDVARRIFGPQNTPALREILDDAVAEYAN